MKKVISAMLSMLLIVNLFSVMGITVSAEDEITVNVGDTVSTPEGPGSDYSYEHYATWTFSDDSLAELEVTGNQPHNKITFFKAGRLVVTTH